MFSILPDECLLLIIKEVIDRPNESNNLSNLIPNCFGIKKFQDYNHFIDRLVIGVNWKKNKKHNFTKNILWQPLPTTFIIPLLLVSKEINQLFDRELLWNFIYINEFRKGEEYKRKPKNMKQLLKGKFKLILNDRYNPQLELIKIKGNELRENIKKDITSINILVESLSKIKPNTTDLSDENINHLRSFRSPSIMIESGKYINRYGYTPQYSMVLSLNHVSRELSYIHKRVDNNIKKLRLYNKHKKDIIKIMEKY